MFDVSAADYVGFVGTEISEATEDAVDRSMLDAFVALVTAQGGGLIADLGCGPGRAAALLRRGGLDVVGIDISTELLAMARSAHPDIRFEEGRIDDLPFSDGALAGAVSWYSIIYTAPTLLDDVFAEIARVLAPEGFLLVSFQVGSGQGDERESAFGTGLPLTVYQHDVNDVEHRLEAAAFTIHARTVRNPRLGHEVAPQAFVLARRVE